MRVKRKMPKRGEQDERGVEAGAGAGGRSLRAVEEAAGEGLEEEREGEDRDGEGDACGDGEGSGGGCAAELEELDAGRHRPIEQWGFFEVADAVGVEGDVVVAEQHLAGDLGVHGVGVVEERGMEEGEAGVEGDPEGDERERVAERTPRDACVRHTATILESERLNADGTDRRQRTTTDLTD
jgi:hypothetical protein